MDVLELLGVLLVGQYIEVVVAALPELHAIHLKMFGGLSLQDSESCGERLPRWLGEKQVNVLGHEDVAEEIKAVTLPDSFQCLLEEDAGLIIDEVGETPIATEGDEVVAPFSLIALQAVRHGSIVAQTLFHPGSSFFATPLMMMKPS